MKKWTTLDQALTRDGKIVSLHEHDGSYTIRVDGATLMSTRQHASEETLARLACAHLKSRARARVLIGGLGFGFTLRASLAILAPDATVEVAEILASVIAWNRNPLYPLAAGAMADPRVKVLQQDVAEVIRQNPGAFDAILLDVDNGAAGLSMGANDRLYDYAGLAAARAALKPGGCVAFWSAAANAAFERLLARAGFQVQVEHCRARPHAGSRHTIFLGRASQSRNS